MSTQANVLMTDARPWDKQTPPAEVQAVTQLVHDTLRVCGIFLQPFMPSKAATLLDALGVPEDSRTCEHADVARAPPCTGIQSGVILFPKIKPAVPQTKT